MWIPRDTADLERAISAGTLEETATFDAKAALPASAKQNSSLAIDVAAMSTAGGVLLYGVGEDENDRLTVRAPFELAGAAERVAQILETSIAEIPKIEFRRYELSDDPSKGYMMVIVAPSPRAPHQVIVGDDRRFYGRGAKGNRRLGEQEIAQLYARRQQQAIDLDKRLSEAVAASRFQPEEDFGYLYAFVQPVPPATALWDAAVDRVGGRQELLQRLSAAAKAGPEIEGGHDPHFRGSTNWFAEGADAWRLSSQWKRDDDQKRARHLVEITLGIDGRAVLFSGHIAGRVSSRMGASDEEGLKYIWEPVAAGNLAAFFSFMSVYFTTAGYFGPVDCGVQITGIDGGVSTGRFHGRHRQFITWSEVPQFTADRYRQVCQLAAASELAGAADLSLSLLRRLTEATTGRNDYDPFIRSE